MFIYSPEEEEVFFDRIDQVFVLAEAGKTAEAEELLLEIEASVPDPKESSSVGAILLDGIYSFYEQQGEPEKALPYFLTETEYLQEKMKDGKINHPGHFITTGSIFYAEEDLDKARKYFGLAYQSGTKTVFEDYNPDFLYMALATDAEFDEFKSNFVPLADQEQDELTDEQQDLLDQYCEQGDAEMEDEHFMAAAELFRKAYAILPDPKEEWEASGYITASLGDALFSAGKFDEALGQLQIAHAFYSSGEQPNPFVLLRLGETLFELGDEKQALVHLLKAYQMEGQQLFEDDKKYLKFLKKHHQL